MTHLFIINPAAGSRDRTQEFTQAIETHCAQSDLSCRIAVSAAPGDCTRLAREAAESGEEYRIYACGGDGTLNEVIQGIAGYENVAVSVYAGGSGNDFIKIFDQPQAFTDLPRLLDATETTFDLIDCNGSLCMNICSVGFDARIGLDMSKFKHLPLLHGYGAYAASTVLNIIKGISEHYIIQVNGETLDARQTLVCACNGRHYGGDFHPVPTADPADGLLDVLIVKGVSRLKLARLIGIYKAGNYPSLPEYVRHLKTKDIKILCDKPTAIQLDGEMRIAQEFHIRISDKKIRFFYPRQLSWQVAEPVAAK